MNLFMAKGAHRDNAEPVFFRVPHMVMVLAGWLFAFDASERLCRGHPARSYFPLHLFTGHSFRGARLRLERLQTFGVMLVIGLSLYCSNVFAVLNAASLSVIRHSFFEFGVILNAVVATLFSGGDLFWLLLAHDPRTLKIGFSVLLIVLFDVALSRFGVFVRHPRIIQKSP